MLWQCCMKVTETHSCGDKKRSQTDRSRSKLNLLGNRKQNIVTLMNYITWWKHLISWIIYCYCYCFTKAVGRERLCATVILLVKEVFCFTWCLTTSLNHGEITVTHGLLWLIALYPHKPVYFMQSLELEI